MQFLLHSNNIQDKVKRTYFSKSTQHLAIRNLHFDEFNFFDRNAE